MHAMQSAAPRNGALSSGGRSQVLLPAALCCSVSVVQACSRVVAPGLLAQRGPYDPCSALLTTGRIALFFSSAAVPHTSAGVLSCTFLVATCSAWPSTLNVVPLCVLSWVLWRWAHPQGNHTMPKLEPFLSSRSATALSVWAAVQLAITYAAQIPQVAAWLVHHHQGWLHLSVLYGEHCSMATGLLAAHAAALLGLYLSLNALAGCSSTDVRLWPQPADVAAVVAEQIDAQQAMQSASDAHAGTATEPSFDAHDDAAAAGPPVHLSPMLARCPSTPARGNCGHTPRLPWPAESTGNTAGVSTGMCSLGHRSEGGMLTPQHTSPASLGSATVVAADAGLPMQRSSSGQAPSFADQLRVSGVARLRLGSTCRKREAQHFTCMQGDTMMREQLEH